MRLIIAGSRDFDDYELLEYEVGKVIDQRLRSSSIEIVSGGARGADALGERYAEDYGLHIRKFLADWDKEGKVAGFIRNREMAEYATHCIVFWDGFSRGSRHMIDTALENGLQLTVVRWNK